MDKLFKKFFRSSMITSLVLVAFGIMLIMKSEATIITISYVLGGILVALGVLAVIKFIQGTNKENKNELDIVYGVVTVILGVLIITHPQAIASIIPLVLGVAIVISSSTKLQYAFELKANNNSLWKATMVVSIISTLCGILLLFNPFKGAVILTKIIGGLILVYAVLDIVSTLSIKKNVARIHNAIEESITDAVIIEEETNDKKTKKEKRKKQKEDKE